MKKERSLPSREAWIEIYDHLRFRELANMSLPSREAWIEIAGLPGIPPSSKVASLAGSVD